MSRPLAPVLAFCGFAVCGWVAGHSAPGRAAEPAPDALSAHPLPRETRGPVGMDEFLWDSDTTFRGTISVSHAYASDTAGPSTRGLRVGYGYLGGEASDYPWGELWLTFREDGDHDILAGGLSAVPLARVSRRFGLGFLVDLGVSRRRDRGRSRLAGLIGAGGEGVVRISRGWDLVTTAEAVYRTPDDVELQGRVGFRFHHRKMPSIRGN